MRHLKFLSLAAACVLSAASPAQVGEDVTALLSDPTMEGVAHWTNNNFKDNHRNAAYPLFDGFFIEAWSSSSSSNETYLGTRSLTDTLRSIPNGTYLFTSAVMACQQSGSLEQVSGAYIFANDDMLEVSTATGVPERFYVMTTVADGQMVVGFRTVETDANWMAVDNARLYYYDREVDPASAVASLKLKELYDEAARFPDSLAMQRQALADLNASLGQAAELLASPSPSTSEVNSMYDVLKSRLDEAEASVAAYAEALKAIEAARAVYETYADEQDVSDERAALLAAIDEAQAACEAMEAGSEQMKGLADRLAEASSVMEVAVVYFVVADVINDILSYCEAGTSYGTYPQSQMDRIAALQIDLEKKYDDYTTGAVAPSDMLAALKEAQQTIELFYQSMILIDFTMPLNFSLWPFDATDDVAAFEHDEVFSCSDPDSPWAFGGLDNYNDSLTIWNIDDNSYAKPATEKASADCYGWSDAYTSGWFFLQSDGVFQPRGTAAVSTSPSVVFTAPESAIYFVKVAVASTDSKRTNGAYDANNTQLGAYYQQKGEVELHLIGETTPYWYDQPAAQDFYVNLQKGDKVVLSLGETVADGHGGARVDTLYVLGSKDEETGYTLEEVKGSGLLFYNAYVPAENWADLEAAIDAARAALAAKESDMGDGLGQTPETAFFELDALVVSADRMMKAAVASQPDVDAMTGAILKGIGTFAGSVNAGICLGTEEAPSDSTLFVNHVFMPDGLYYIVDAATGLYMTAPAAGDKAAVYFEELLDETLTEQNSQVWHFNWLDTLSCYGVGSHANTESQLWTLDQELAAGDEAMENGFYHISENSARYGTSWFVVNRVDEALWRGQRVYSNGTNFTIIAGRNQGFNTVWGIDSSNKLTFSTGAERNFCFRLVKFDPANGVNTPSAVPAPIARTYYTVQGVQVNEPFGLVIERTLWSDGTLSVKKIMRK